MSAPDIIGALVALLKAEAGIAAMVGDRVFGIELPQGEAKAMPRAGVIIRPSGGVSPVGGYVEVMGERVDAISWGQKPHEAWALSGLVMTTFHRVRRQVIDVDGAGILIHSVEVAGGRLHLRDQDTNWPAITQSFQPLYSLNEAA